MDKPSDVVFKPFKLPGDEQAVLADWKREHPEEAALMRQYPNPLDAREDERAAQMYERAQGQRLELEQNEGWPQSRYDYRAEGDLPQSSAAVDVEQERVSLRRASRGGLPDAPETVSRGK